MSSRQIRFYQILLLLMFSACQRHSASPDNVFDVSVSNPRLVGKNVHIIFDEAHKNHHRLDWSYKPFAKLVCNEGCSIKASDKPITASLLASTDIYIVATAMGAEEPGEKSPFTDDEVNSLEEWVKNGGSALIVTEHYPFGLAMKPLLQKFGVTVHNGYTEDSTLVNKEANDALVFETSKGNIDSSHPITKGIDRITTFTGASVKGDSTWTQLLTFSNHAQNYNVDVKVNRKGGDVSVGISYADFYPANGYAQGICKQYGKGKVVVLAESAMLTAQLDKNKNKFGMNITNTDNKEFVLGIIRWLAAKG